MALLNRLVRNHCGGNSGLHMQVSGVVADILRWLTLFWHSQTKLYRVTYLSPVVSCILHGYTLGSVTLAQKFMTVSIILVQVTSNFWIFVDGDLACSEPLCYRLILKKTAAIFNAC